MFGLGTGEIIIILVVALLVLGPAKLPEIARSLGKSIAELRKAMNDVTSQIVNDKEEADDSTNSIHRPD